MDFGLGHGLAVNWARLDEVRLPHEGGDTTLFLLGTGLYALVALVAAAV